ncbi:hypothetical protein AVEN_219174-1 [Araneus ventricosus]|uniref:Integrase catalytic domain-containing protein n=1 Tax=Araneus ventricosus TaxID=182803 RepID=A0A4Y2FNH7_ARAVE|nr:hypothetical protein AVEN_219174-1 [Araneus ventricosus]
MEAIPLDNISADTVARVFYSNWIARFGMPHRLFTERGSQYPACKGKVERLHRTLRTALKAHSKLSWSDKLPTILLGLHSAIQEDNNHSFVRMVYGDRLRLPGEFFSESSIQTASESFTNNLQKQMKTAIPRTNRKNSSQQIFLHKDLEKCFHVF